MARMKSKIGQVVIPLLPVNRRAFDILRYQLRELVTTSTNFNPLTLRKMRDLKRSRDLSINVASGATDLQAGSISNFSAPEILQYASIFDVNCPSLTALLARFSLSTSSSISISGKIFHVFFESFTEFWRLTVS